MENDYATDAARLATLQNIIGEQLSSEDIQSTIRTLVSNAGREEDAKNLLSGSGIIEKLSEKIANNIGLAIYRSESDLKGLRNSRLSKSFSGELHKGMPGRTQSVPLLHQNAPALPKNNRRYLLITIPRGLAFLGLPDVAEVLFRDQRFSSSPVMSSTEPIFNCQWLLELPTIELFFRADLIFSTEKNFYGITRAGLERVFRGGVKSKVLEVKESGDMGVTVGVLEVFLEMLPRNDAPFAESDVVALEILARGRTANVDFLLLGLSLNAYMTLGSSKTSEAAAWVTTISSMGVVEFWDPVLGTRWLAKDVEAHGYRTVGCLFSHEVFYANANVTDSVKGLDFDLARDWVWKPIPKDAAAMSRRRTAEINFPILPFQMTSIASSPKSPPSQSLSIHEEDLESILKQQIAAFREDYDMRCLWDDDISRLFSQCLWGCEMGRLLRAGSGGSNGRFGVGECGGDGRDGFSGGFPCQFTTLHPSKMFSLLVKSNSCKDLMLTRGDKSYYVDSFMELQLDFEAFFGDKAKSCSNHNFQSSKQHQHHRNAGAPPAYEEARASISSESQPLLNQAEEGRPVVNPKCVFGIFSVYLGLALIRNGSPAPAPSPSPSPSPENGWVSSVIRSEVAITTVPSPMPNPNQPKWDWEPTTTQVIGLPWSSSFPVLQQLLRFTGFSSAFVPTL
ncbi:hypothetical protein BC829DRAFT_413695 [Chytridium lagenaria]|nr:hypothetical protein BC829DRAFT_413695 [Chytridium lagenaria]